MSTDNDAEIENQNQMQNQSKVEFDEFEHKIEPKYKATLAILVGIIGTIVVAWILGGPLGSLMAWISETRFYHFIPFLLSVTFFGILAYRVYIQEIRGLGFLGTAVLLHGIAEGINTIAVPTGTFLNRNGKFGNIADLLFPISIIFLYLHIELTDKRRPNLVHAVGILGSALPIIIGGALLIILEPFSTTSISLGPFPNILISNIYNGIKSVVLVYFGIFSLIILWIGLFSFDVMYGTLQHADSPDIARSSTFVLAGFSALLSNFLLLGISYSSVLFDSPVIFGGTEIEVYNTWIVTFALVLLLLAYILSPKFAYAVPFDVYQLIVINQIDGVTLYSFTNEVRDDGEVTHDALKSPAIVAIQDLVKEIAQAEGYIVLIGMSDRIIAMENHEEIVSVLITEKDSYFLNKGMEDFTTAFYKRFSDEIKNFYGNVDVFREADQLVNKFMPFLRDESLV